MSGSLAVVILTLNEEKNLPRLLDSLTTLGARIFVMDSGSTDSTVEIAEAAGAVVWRHPFDNYAAQRNRAQSLLPDDADWILHLDADERLTPELAEEIKSVLEKQNLTEDGFMLKQRTEFMGRWIRHGGHYPAFHLRLFRKELGKCEDRLYDQHFLVSGRVGTLRNDYIDAVAADIRSWSIRHVRWAELEAEEILSPSSTIDQVKPRVFGSPIQRRRWLRVRVLYRSPLLIRAFAYFFYRYFLRLGFLDGREGLIFHFLQGCWYRFLVDATVVERKLSAESR